MSALLAVRRVKLSGPATGSPAGRVASPAALVKPTCSVANLLIDGIGAAPASAKHNGKRAAEDEATSDLFTPPVIVKRRLVAAPAHRATVALTICAAGCLRTDPHHVGLCETADGLAPPSIKRVNKYFKAEPRDETQA